MLPTLYAQRAQEYERAGDLRRALYSWEIVRALSPDTVESVQNVARLKESIRTKTEEHFAKGVAYFRANDGQGARREFLATLFYDPDHKQALGYLKFRLVQQDSKSYQTTRGDTARTIARREYGDQKLAFLVAYFNDLSEDAELEPGLTLQLPLLPTATGKRRPQTDDMVDMAKALYQAGEYEQSVSVARGVLANDPAQKEAAELMRASTYETGRSLLRDKRYVEALKVFRSLKPDYRDVRQIIQILEKNLQSEAEGHYKKGLVYYSSGDLDKAIAEWQETLRLNPTHPQAGQDLTKARQQRERLDRAH
ncbi:MAG TPA: tetratricopeptide repeat protein [Syntrophobacteria bacterium]|nr:tetratricopeptide repeat protein [Syntrophobacteria bacterium]